MLHPLAIVVGLLSVSLGRSQWTKPSIVDLSYAFDKTTVYWPGQDSFVLEETFKGFFNDFWFESNRFSAAEHGGTHMDAPAHFAKGKWYIADIPVKNLIGPAVVIDISTRARMDSDAQLGSQDIINWENKHGRIPYGAIVLMKSGWGAKWPNKEEYFGSVNYNDTSTLHFPGFHVAAVEWLLNNRTIVGLGVDTPSIDYGQSTEYLVHQTAYSTNVYGLENVANLHLLPPVGATVIVMPMKIKSGSGAPCRITALLPDSAKSSGAIFYRVTTSIRAWTLFLVFTIALATNY